MPEIEVRTFATTDVKEVYVENLFNDPRHVLLQGDDIVTYNLYVDGQIWGTCHFKLQDETAFSPQKSLFGAFELRKKINYEELLFFYKEVEKDLISRKIEKVVVTLPANFFHKSRIKLMKNVLEDNGFSRIVKLKNHSIDVAEAHISSIVHPMEKRKLKKCNDTGVQVFHEPVEMLPVVYEFIRLCRKEKKQPVSIEFEKLQKSFELFPDNYFLFTAKKNNEIYAATVAVKVNEKVLYNFLPASPGKFNDLSPTVKLIDGLYDFAYKNGFKCLDLGVSTTPEGKNQKTLIDFKKRMGGQKSSKLKLGKMLIDKHYWYA